MDLGRHIRQATKLPSHTAIVIMADGFGVEMEGQNIRVGECDDVTYLEDGEQLINLLYRLCPVQP